jgi:hypothetical protein
MTTRWARFARGWVAAIVSTFVAVLSHALAGGSIPGGAGIALCLAFSAVICVFLAGKTLSRVRLTVSVAVSQFLFHGLFGLLTDAPAPPAASHAMSMDPSAGLAVSLPAQHATLAMPMDARMWVGHAGAAVVTIIALRHGESAFWGLLDVARLTLTRLFGHTVAVGTSSPSRPHTIASDRARLPRPIDELVSMLRHRGPPGLSSRIPISYGAPCL